MKTRFNRRFEKDKTPSRTVLERYRQDVQDNEDQDEDDDSGLGLLHYRGGKEEYQLGAEYSESSDPLDRALGAKILAQLGWDDQTFLEESVEILVKLLDDADPNVVYSAAVALSHRSDERAIIRLVSLSTHEDALIRFGVAHGLAAGEAPEAIAALIQLSKDEDRDVRDYAVFGLGSRIECDTPEVREALYAALQDADSEIRGEALVGLAERKDSRVKEAILGEWKTDEVSVLSLEAAEVLGDPDFLPFLLEFQEMIDSEEEDHVLDQLNAAIAACEAGRPS